MVSERLGHSTIGITLDLYSHGVPSLDREAAETIAALIDLQPSERPAEATPSPSPAAVLQSDDERALRAEGRPVSMSTNRGGSTHGRPHSPIAVSHRR